MDLPMKEQPDAFFARDRMHPGYALGDVPANLDYAWTQEYSLEEYLLCAMYEGGEFCGHYYDCGEEQPTFTWALLPETPEDVQHIEQVILMYGRAARLKNLEEP